MNIKHATIRSTAFPEAAFPNLQFAICNLQFAIIIFLGGIISHRDMCGRIDCGVRQCARCNLRRGDPALGQDGNHRNLPDPKAKIDATAVDAAAEKTGGGTWVFKNLPAGKYDLVILAKDRVRIEGFQYPPVKEFDPFIPARFHG